MPETGNDPNKLRKYFSAAAQNDLEIVKKFIEVENTPIDIGTLGDRETAAHIAAKNGHLDIVRYMVEKCPSLAHAADAAGNTLIFLAIRKGALDIVKYLIEKHKVDIFQRHRNFPDQTTISSAIQRNHFDIVKYFFEEKGVDVNISEKRSDPPIFTAMAFNRTNIFKYLVEDLNASLTTLDEFNDNILFKTVLRGDLSSMKYILDEKKAGLDVNWQNELGYTLVHRACMRQRFEILKYLVEEKHADIHVRENENMTALHIAAFKNDQDICQYLIEQGADVRAVDIFGKTPVDEVTDSRLKDYFQNITMHRNRRCVNWPFHSSLAQFIPYALPGARLADRLSEDSAVDRSVEVNDVYFPQIANPFGLTQILVMLSAVVGDRRQRQPSGSENSRIDPVAVDIIDSVGEPFVET